MKPDHKFKEGIGIGLDDVGTLRNIAANFPNDQSYGIYTMFIWTQSPQGNLYWSRIANHEQPMTDDDRQFLRDRADFIEELIISGVKIW